MKIFVAVIDGKTYLVRATDKRQAAIFLNTKAINLNYRECCRAIQNSIDVEGEAGIIYSGA